MKITVAGEKKEVAEGLTVAALIEQEKVETPQYVTVSINEEFLESGTFESTTLKEGDEVEFLYFMGGGAVMRSMTMHGSDEMPPNEMMGRFLMIGGAL